MLLVNQDKFTIFISYLGVASYFAVAAYLLKSTGIDKKVFDFSAPKVSHAAFQGATLYLSFQTSDSAARLCTKTETKWVPSSGMYDRGHYKTTSEYPGLYRASEVCSSVLATFASTYMLNLMNYQLPYRFAPICCIPLVVLV